MGTHEALMEKGGVYHDLYSLQFRSGESDHLQFLMQE